MPVETKALAPFEVKAADSATRTFEGLASTWDLDLGGDVIHKGAFGRWLKAWKSSGAIIPLLDQHHYSSVIRDRLGKLIDAKETDEGLWTKWKVFETTAGNDLMAMLREGGIDGLSIGFDIVKSEDEVTDGRTTRHIRDIELHEVSAVHWGMNPHALVNLSTVKSALAGMDGADLTDDERKELRALASRIGNLLKSSAPAPAPAADQADDEAQAATQPDATPSEEAASQTAESEPEYRYSEALQQRLLGLKLKRHTTMGGMR